MPKQKVETYEQVSTAPTNKVAAAGIGGALAIVLIWIAGLFNVEVPPEVAASIAAIVSFATGYLVREKRVVER
jgi:putative flippase GtrA